MLDALIPTPEQQSGMPDPRYHREAFEGKPGASRIYKPHRQRTRRIFTKTPVKDQLLRRMGEETIGVMRSGAQAPNDLIVRQTLCLPGLSEDSILHSGDDGFTNTSGRYFPAAEGNASECLVNLKSRLRKADTYDFWRILLEEMCNITGAQCGLVAKRMLVDDQDSAVELPELGEEGSCSMGVAFYTKSGSNETRLERDYKYTAFGTPCAHMKYDKVVIVPERMKEVTSNNSNIMPWGQSEAFIGVPLSVEDKSFAHFALLWSEEGAQKRKLSWSFIEMFMHSLEDMVLQRIMEGPGFAKDGDLRELNPAKIIPLSAITASQSLKPFARSLSHELRTPMQGVVGMLDIMYSTVLDAIANQQNERVRSVFADLKANIEVVQESSKRAIEAADNVVHAYDLNMQMPDVPLTPEDDGNRSFASIQEYSPPSSGHLQQAFPSPTLKKRCRSEDLELNLESPSKRMFTYTESDMPNYLPELDSSIIATAISSPESSGQAMINEVSSETQMELNLSPFDSNPSPLASPASINSGHQRVITRDFMRNLISDALKSDHPTSEHHTTTEFGEKIEVQTRGLRGGERKRVIELVIQPDVPAAILTEEQHLQFSVSKIVDNAIKFTDRGSITITVKLSNNGHMVEIWVVDTGCGINEKSKSRLFQPHFQENASTSRSKDGLGLSLFNAKAHARRNLGGDVTLERSATAGPSKGSEFLIRLPISTLDMTRSVTPLVGSSPSHPRITRDAVISPYTTIPVKTPRRRTTPNVNLAKEYPLNFLVAEDNEINRKLACAALSKLGYSAGNVTLAFDGADAVRTYEASLSKPTNRYDIILMDIWMPNMDGYQATKEILKLAEAHGEVATIVAVTADITDDCSMRAKEAGMQSFLAKPYRVIDMEKLIIGNFQQGSFCCSK